MTSSNGQLDRLSIPSIGPAEIELSMRYRSSMIFFRNFHKIRHNSYGQSIARAFGTVLVLLTSSLPSYSGQTSIELEFLLELEEGSLVGRYHCSLPDVCRVTFFDFELIVAPQIDGFSVGISSVENIHRYVTRDSSDSFFLKFSSATVSIEIYDNYSTASTDPIGTISIKARKENLP